MRDWTSRELATFLHVDPLVSYGFIKFLQAKGLVSLSGKKKADGAGRGKPEYLYTFAENADVGLSELLKLLLAQERK